MFLYTKKFDVIVVGAGHAGVEAALAAARTGSQTLLLTISADAIGQMSCNPAIGGLAKGHLVREIDALGGEMGKAADMTGLQFRMLNTKKGPAVWSPRAQCDKKAYQYRIKWICEKQSNLDIKQDHVTKLLHKNGEIFGVQTALEVQYIAKTVIITTGTFLHGLMHVGSNKKSGGRAGEIASVGLSAALRELGFELGRLKTGTPPRLLRRSIDFSKTQVQHGDEPIPFFTYWKELLFHMEHSKSNSIQNEQFNKYPKNSILWQINCQLPCHLTYTTKATSELVRANLSRSPMYSGVIDGVGPRYCPSIEDKVVKFSSKDRHQIFLEPEGISTEEIYLNGLSTCLPYDIQVDLVKTIEGCENADIIRPAYAVEYDFVFPTQLFHSLETKVCRNLYLAGQINGTSGYEEAAAQGLMAGINASRRAHKKEPIVLNRSQAYTGVLIDDLVTKGTIEPYRMFTSRAEHRLLLRQDNADIRLSQIGYSVGLISNEQHNKILLKIEKIDMEILRLEKTRIDSENLAQLLRRPEISYKDLPGKDDSLENEIIQQVEISLKYTGYIERQEKEVVKFKQMESNLIPKDFDYDLVPSLRIEARQKLKKIRPSTLGQASRISGVSPADVGILIVWLKRDQTVLENVDMETENGGDDPEVCN